MAEPPSGLRIACFCADRAYPTCSLRLGRLRFPGRRGIRDRSLYRNAGKAPRPFPLLCHLCRMPYLLLRACIRECHPECPACRIFPHHAGRMGRYRPAGAQHAFLADLRLPLPYRRGLSLWRDSFPDTFSPVSLPVVHGRFGNGIPHGIPAHGLLSSPSCRTARTFLSRPMIAI